MSDDNVLAGIITTKAEVAKTLDNGDFTVVYTPSRCQHGALAYTVGLTAHDKPEIIITGLPVDLVPEILHAAIGHFLDQVPADGERVHELIEVHPMLARVADTEHLVIAKEFFFASEVKAMQLLWPDFDGRFPGDPECLLDDHIQPRLFTTKETA